MKLIFTAFLLFSLAIKSHSQTFSQSTLPIVVINTYGKNIPDDPKITVNMGIINNGEGLINHLTDSFNEYNGPVGIELRGNSSLLSPKKSYALETRDTNGEDVAVSFFGFPAEADWTLIATPGDRTLLKNIFAYDLWQKMGYYSVRTKFVEVVLNGSYQGVYVFTEKIKRDKNRVDIKKLEPTDTSPTKITGGFIFKNDWDNNPQDKKFFSYESNQYKIFILEYPKAEDITNDQWNYLKSYFATFETTLKGSNYADPVNGYKKYIYEDTFIDFFLMQEFGKNLDGFNASIFFHKEREDKIKIGPLWDMDGAFQSQPSSACCDLHLTSGWIFSGNHALAAMDHFWWEKLLTDCDYSQKLRARYQELRNTVWSDQTVLSNMDSLNNYLNADGAATRNFNKWQYTLFGVAVNHASEVTNMKNWMIARLHWMDANLYTIDPYGIEINGGSNQNANFGQAKSFTTNKTCPNGGQLKWTYSSAHNSGTYLGNTLSLTAVEPTVVQLRCLQANNCEGFPSKEVLVNLVNQPCPSVLNTSTVVISPANPVGVFQATTKINATNDLKTGTYSIFKASGNIEFLPGFKAESGSIFETKLEGCD